MIYERVSSIILLTVLLVASIIVYSYSIASNNFPYAYSSLAIAIVCLASLYRELSYIFKIIDRELEFIENNLFKGDRK